MTHPILPIPRFPITIRPAAASDLPFIDALQKQHTKQVGWMPTKQLEGKIAAGQVIVAAEESGGGGGWGDGEVGGREQNPTRPTHDSPLPNTPPPHLPIAHPVGYCIGQDQYFKRDDVGIIYQLNVVTGRQRGLIGATLLRAMFERAAWGVRLFCCWCAQDIEANRFWEAMGFVPLAFRAGSASRSRVHIFWQRRIVAGDVTTPWWFPSQTTSGSIREDRIVLPIPPGTHWSDAKPIVLPSEHRMLPERSDAAVGRRKRSGATPRPPKPREPKRQTITSMSGLWFPVANDCVSEKTREKKPREPKAKVKNDPKLIAAARELRDRWLEHVNAHPEPLLPEGKYDVSRALPDHAMQMPGTLAERKSTLALPLALPAPAAA